MKHYVGLDVGLEETNLCIVDGDGKTVRDVKVNTEPVTDPLRSRGLRGSPCSNWPTAMTRAALRR